MKHLKQVLFIVAFFFVAVFAYAAYQPTFSTAGFYSLPNTGRQVYSFNPAWRFFKGKVDHAYQKEFNDQQWEVVSLPHGIEYLPLEASGCVNYQGEVWYRKHFVPNESLKGKKIFLHFEAIMGKSKVYLNGHLLTTHFGGYLPVIVDVTNKVEWGEDNVVAVWSDNSNDTMYPPGKAQEVLDYTYFGGIYRDCWLIAHKDVFITDPNYENTVAGGGVFVSYDHVSEASAEVRVDVQVKNEQSKSFKGNLEIKLCQQNDKVVKTIKRSLHVKNGKYTTSTTKMKVENPALWTPDDPELYYLDIRIKDAKGHVVDGYRKRIGIRSFAFKGEEGFWLNGKPFDDKLIGANRHQDYAVIGNAVPNSLHWRDAKKLRDVGLRVIRNAHCPQDPAFMDACDELGLLVIDNTPGWQFWNKDPIFATRVYQDIRNVVRRDRNHPSVWLWEPILNETSYPLSFAKRAHDIVAEEYPYASCQSACDNRALGSQYYTVRFSHPENSTPRYALTNRDPKITYFTREWGDNVDDWKAHNSPSRVARNWGEHAMTVQAHHYACPPYQYSTYDGLYQTEKYHMGGCLWHSFDHQRGYHPDPFYGGIMDVFRQPKLSYYMFMAQRPPIKKERLYETGPMVYIANKMTPFSAKDVDVYSNCDQVRLTFNKGGKTSLYTKDKNRVGMPSPIITFPDVFDFMTCKALDRDGKKEEVYLLAEGLMAGKVVVTDTVKPAFRPTKLLLWADNEGLSLKANGSDIVTVIAAVADENGTIKRLNNYSIRFEVEGEGHMLGGTSQLLNPEPVRWGTAPLLVQSTLHPGAIKIKATVMMEGVNMPTSAELTLHSVAPDFPLIYNSRENALNYKIFPLNEESFVKQNKHQSFDRKSMDKKLKEVEKQQADFEK